MKRDAPQSHEYRQARQRLLAVMTRCAGAQSAWSPTPLRTELSSIAKDLRELAGRVDLGPAWSQLEDYADKTAGRRGAVKSAAGAMIELAELADEAAAELPNPRARPWLIECAQLFVHVRYRCGFPMPSLYDEGPDVVELGCLLAESGAPKSSQRIRGLLCQALAAFDPHLPPPGLDDVL